MKTIFFRTQEAFIQQMEDHLADGATVIEGPVQIPGGETTGAHVFMNGELTHKLILDSLAYCNASFQEQGE
jgi:hypothetical protein